MMPLAGKVTVINEFDFSDYVSKLYNRPYRFQQQDDCRYGQDSVHFFSVPEPEGEYDSIEEFRDRWMEGTPTVEEWANTPIGEYEFGWQRDIYWEREFYPPFETVVNDLYKRGLLPEGQYALHIWW
jgi:hypothetical protein